MARKCLIGHASCPSVEALAIAQQPKTSLQADSVERVVTLFPARVSKIDGRIAVTGIDEDWIAHFQCEVL